jgi:hypothetical protein
LLINSPYKRKQHTRFSHLSEAKVLLVFPKEATRRRAAMLENLSSRVGKKRKRAVAAAWISRGDSKRAGLRDRNRSLAP